MTDSEKQFANTIYNSIQIIITEQIKQSHNLDTMDKQLEYTHQEKVRITNEQLLKKGILN